MTLEQAIEELQKNDYVPYGTIVRFLTELRERRESELRPATKYLNKTELEQWLHVRSENREELEAFQDYRNNPSKENLNALLLELGDGQMTRETMLAILGLDEHQRNEVRRQVIEKNRVRKYYESV